MGKFDGFLICTDLDGTLLNSKREISDENVAAIRHFQKEGGIFTFVTGRMPQYAKECYDLVKPNGPVGCVNGGGLYDFEKQEYLWTQELPYEAVELISAIDEAYPEIGIQVAAFSKSYFCKYNDTLVNFRHYNHLPDYRCHYARVPEPMAKVLFGTDDELLMQQLEHALHSHPKADNFGFVRTQSNLFEILPQGVCKGTAIEKLVELLGLDINKTIALGDYDNDISMFHAAKLGVAVANACPDALAAADYVTVSNDEHAIAKLIAQLEAGELL